MSSSLSDSSPDRRGFLGFAAGIAGSVLLSGCGGTEGGTNGTTATGGPAAAPKAPPIAAATAPPAVEGSSRLNLALNLSYIGAQFYGYAARGSGVPGAATAGVGSLGAATGARQVSFGDPVVAQIAVDLADDKLAHVMALRGQLGELAAAQPRIDLSTGSTGPFSLAAQRAALAGGTFDPYSGEVPFLIGAFLVENRVAAAYRALLDQAGGDASAAAIQPMLGDAIYHGGLIRTLLDDRAASDPTIGKAVADVGIMLDTLDGSNVGDQTLAGANGESANIQDADGRPIPFTRDTSQVLKTLYLSTSSFGGFLPAGANGIPA